MKTLEAKKLIVHTLPLNPEIINGVCSYVPGSFPVWEFSNGCIIVIPDTDCDYFFNDRRYIEANGFDQVDYVEDTDEVAIFYLSCLKRTVGQNIKLGYTVPDSAFRLIGKRV